MRVAVLGAGIVGLCCAHALLRDGHEVVLIDRDGVGGGATPGNAGWVCPSQVAPLAAPGMLRHSAGLLLRRTSPLYIAPRPNREMRRFLVAFARRCTQKAYAEAVAALVELASTVEEDYGRLEDEIGLHRQRSGVLCCFTDAEGARRAHASFDRAGPLLDADAMAETEPALTRRVAAGFLLAEDSYLDPRALAAALRTHVEAGGAKVVEQAGTCTLLRSGSRIEGVRTSTVGDIPADEVVISAGAGSARYLGELGVRVPLVPGTGYSFTVQPKVMPRRPLHLEEAHVACTPMDGLRVAGTMEISGRTSGIDQRRVEAIVASAGRYLQGVNWEARTDVWGAARPVTSDGLPLLGRPEGIGGCVLACGHGMYGVTLAPTTGRRVAQVISQPPEKGSRNG